MKRIHPVWNTSLFADKAHKATSRAFWTLRAVETILGVFKKVGCQLLAVELHFQDVKGNPKRNRSRRKRALVDMPQRSNELQWRTGYVSWYWYLNDRPLPSSQRPTPSQAPTKVHAAGINGQGSVVGGSRYTLAGSLRVASPEWAKCLAASHGQRWLVWKSYSMVLGFKMWERSSNC